MANSAVLSPVITRLRRWLRVNLFHGKGYRRIQQLANGEKRELAGLILMWLIWLRWRERWRRRQKRLIRKVARAIEKAGFVEARVASRKQDDGPAFEKERIEGNVRNIVTPIIKSSGLFEGGSGISDREKVWDCEFGITKPRRFFLRRRPVLARWPVPCARVIIGHKVSCFVAKRDASGFDSERD
jgi:hypothetical protein